MRRKSEPSAVETEKGFGTGLRVKLEGRKPEPEAGTRADHAEEAAAPADELELETPAAGAAEELSETEQLWAELEDSLAREEQLNRLLDEQARAYEETRELARRLDERAEALRKRELELAAQREELERQAAEPEAEEAVREHGRAYLRRRLEEDAERLWRVFQEALTATRANGEPDFRTRLAAATALLGEAYGETSQLSPGERVAAARDELAGMRAKRAAKPKKR